jgi:hypothetical protein
LTEALSGYELALELEPTQQARRSRLFLKKCQVLVKLKLGADATKACTSALDIDGRLVDALGERGDVSQQSCLDQRTLQNFS